MCIPLEEDMNITNILSTYCIHIARDKDYIVMLQSVNFESWEQRTSNPYQKWKYRMKHIIHIKRGTNLFQYTSVELSSLMFYEDYALSALKARSKELGYLRYIFLRLSHLTVADSLCLMGLEKIIASSAHKANVFLQSYYCIYSPAGLYSWFRMDRKGERKKIYLCCYLVEIWVLAAQH